MSVQGPQTQSTMTTMEMAKSFSPIILFSIVLPLIDIFTDLRMILILFSRSFLYCISNDVDISISNSDYQNCRETYYKEAFCKNQPNLCNIERHNKFATLLLGKYKKVF